MRVQLRLTRISECEPTHLRIILELLHTNGSRASDNLKPGNDTHTLGSKSRWLLGLTSGTLFEFMEQSGESNFLSCGVDVHDTVVACRQDGFEFE